MTILIAFLENNYAQKPEQKKYVRIFTAQKFAKRFILIAC